MKLNKNIKISIGISAYNEQKNIRRVIEGVLNQKLTGSNLSELLIFTDGCTDATLKNILNIKSKKIKVFEGKKRRGKTYRLNQMFKIFNGDILIMFDADISFKNKNVVYEMVKVFKQDKKIMLVGGNSTPLLPKGFFQRAVYSTFKVFYASRFYFNKGNNIFGCTGSILGIRKQFAKKINLPDIVNEDAYLYLACKLNNYLFRYTDSAVVYYKLPNNIYDYIKQILRSEPKAIEVDLKKYFKNIKKEIKRPFLPYFKSILSEFIKNPLGVSLVVIINIFCIPFISTVQQKYSLAWFTANSTK